MVRTMGSSSPIRGAETSESANLVLMDAVERLQAGNLYAEVPRGLFLIRGENVVLLGEIVRLSQSNGPQTRLTI